MRGSLLSFSHLSVLYFSYKLSFEGGVLTPPDLDDDLRWGVNNPSRSKKAANQSFGTPLLEAANHADIGFHQTPIIDMRHANHPVFTTGKAPAQEAQDAGIKVVFFYVKNHNIPDDKIRNALEAAKTFFSLPTEEKMKIDVRKTTFQSIQWNFHVEQRPRKIKAICSDENAMSGTSGRLKPKYLDSEKRF